MKSSKNSLVVLISGLLIVAFAAVSCSKDGGGDGPRISGITPSSVLTGDYITVSGSNLSESSVLIGGIATGVTDNTSTSFVARVPQGATVGVNEVKVTNSMGTATSSITVTGAGAPPVITSISPNPVDKGASLTITGTGLTNAVIEIATKVSTVSANTATSVTAVVPTNIASGSASVRVTTSLGTVVSSVTVN